MDKLANLALVAQMLESAEKNIQSAKHLLRETLGMSAPSGLAGTVGTLGVPNGGLSVTAVGKIIEGAFDGQNMLGPDGKLYPVPANYASKSKLVEGDVLKLTIAEDGSFIYKQIAPIERKRVLGVLAQDERGDYRVVAEGKPYKILLASLTYFKAGPGDTVVLEIPTAREATWAAVVNVLRGGVLSMTETDQENAQNVAVPEDEEMG